MKVAAWTKESVSWGVVSEGICRMGGGKRLRLGASAFRSAGRVYQPIGSSLLWTLREEVALRVNGKSAPCVLERYLYRPRSHRPSLRGQ
jgi:hypothetical protein